MPKQGTGAEPLKDVVFDGKRERVVENCSKRMGDWGNRVGGREENEILPEVGSEGLPPAGDMGGAPQRRSL